MPESRSRKKPAYTAPPERSSGPKVNPPWFVPVMVALMVIGLVWIVVTYLSGFDYPVPGLRSWNLAIGAAFIVAGFGMTTRWR